MFTFVRLLPRLWLGDAGTLPWWVEMGGRGGTVLGRYSLACRG